MWPLRTLRPCRATGYDEVECLVGGIARDLRLRHIAHQYRADGEVIGRAGLPLRANLARHTLWPLRALRPCRAAGYDEVERLVGGLARDLRLRHIACQHRTDGEVIGRPGLTRLTCLPWLSLRSLWPGLTCLALFPALALRAAWDDQVQRLVGRVAGDGGIGLVACHYGADGEAVGGAGLSHLAGLALLALETLLPTFTAFALWAAGQHEVERLVGRVAGDGGVGLVACHHSANNETIGGPGLALRALLTDLALCTGLSLCALLTAFAALTLWAAFALWAAG